MTVKDIEVMDYTVFDNAEDLAQCMITDVREAECDNVICLCKYDIAKLLIKELLAFYEIEISDIELCDIHSNGYDKEFIISLTDEFRLSCEYAYKNDLGYNIKEFDNSIVYVHTDCSFDSVKDIEDSYDTMLEFEFEETIDEDVEFGCMCCNCNKSE